MSSSRYKINPLVLVATPTLEHRPISFDWMDAMMSLQFPLGASVSRLRIHGKDVAEARNEIVLSALNMGADYILMIGDDNLPPPNLFDLLHRHREHLVTGVYWQKSHPTHPYIWDGLLKGFCEDWKYGEYFPVDFGGCDALLAHTDVFRKTPAPWFSRDWTFEDGQVPLPHLTEDFYFYAKARQAGFRLWVDTAAQLGHQDRTSGIIYGLDRDMPQMQPDAPHPSADPHLLVAEIGAGTHSAWFGANAQITRFDLDPLVQPDVRCDVRAIPRPDATFDIVSARHILEHFMWQEAPALVKEWARILKPCGKLVIRVPNLAHAAREILKADADPAYSPGVYPLWQVYGKQEGAEGEVHRNGFTRHALRSLLEHCGLTEVTVEIAGHMQEDLAATAVKAETSSPLAIGPLLREVEASEQHARQNGASSASDTHTEGGVTRVNPLVGAAVGVVHHPGDRTNG